MLLVSVAAVLALAAAETPEGSAGPQQETPTAAATPDSAKPAKPKKDPSKKVVCQDAPQTGSIIARRICVTQAEWDERARRDKEEWERQNRSGGN